MVTVRPLPQPSSDNRCSKASAHLLHAEGDAAPKKPMVGTLAGCCVRAATGHAAAPPSAAMNSRLRILGPHADRRSLSRSGLHWNRLAGLSSAGLMAPGRALVGTSWRGLGRRPAMAGVALEIACWQVCRGRRWCPTGRFFPSIGAFLRRLDRTSLRLAHLLDHHVGAQQNRLRHGEAERLGGLRV
jgi:hypothetical protein